MDSNNQNSENNIFSNNLAKMLEGTMGFIKSVETGEGLGLSNEQMIEFEKAKNDSGTNAAIKDVKDKLEHLRNLQNKK